MVQRLMDDSAFDAREHFSEPPDIYFAIGAALIIGSGLYVFMRERVVAPRSTAVPAGD